MFKLFDELSAMKVESSSEFELSAAELLFSQLVFVTECCFCVGVLSVLDSILILFVLFSLLLIRCAISSKSFGDNFDLSNISLKLKYTLNIEIDSQSFLIIYLFGYFLDLFSNERLLIDNIVQTLS
jgi:hypothetical protein